jgi:glucokinase
MFMQRNVLYNDKGAMKAIGIDLGGSHAGIAVVEERVVLASEHIALHSEDGLGAALPKIGAAIRGLLAKLKMDTSECAGVALGFCGMVDAECTKVISTNGKYEDATQLDLAGWFGAEFGLRLAAENDARLALLGEWYAGAARDYEDVVMITLGTGIGGAVLIGGKPFRSKQPQAGCLGGHISARFGGPQCSCGAYGCMEAEASGWSLPSVVQGWPGVAESKLSGAAPVNFRAVFELADAGDRVAKEVRDHCLKVWAAGTVGLIHAYGPECVVFGGGVMERAEVVLPFVREYVKKHVWQPVGSTQIVAAALGKDAALYGAVPLLHAGRT